MTIKHISCFFPAPLFLAGGLVGAVFQVFRRTAVRSSTGRQESTWRPGQLEILWLWRNLRQPSDYHLQWTSILHLVECWIKYEGMVHKLIWKHLFQHCSLARTVHEFLVPSFFVQGRRSRNTCWLVLKRQVWKVVSSLWFVNHISHHPAVRTYGFSRVWPFILSGLGEMR